MPRTKRQAVTGFPRQEEIMSALSTVFNEPESIFETIIPFWLNTEGAPHPAIFRLSDDQDRFADLGICPMDIVIIDTSRTETENGDGIIFSVVTDDPSFEGEYLDFQTEEHFGSNDILDLQYLYPDEEEGAKRRRKQGDSPRIERTVIGVLTKVIRSAEKLRGAS